MCLVISHHFGRDGRESSKIDSKGIAIDFELFKSLANEDFISNVMSQIHMFVKSMNENLLHNNGKFIIKMFEKHYNILKNAFLGNTNHTTQSDVKIKNIAHIETSEPSVQIDLSLEVKILESYI